LEKVISASWTFSVARHVADGRASSSNGMRPVEFLLIQTGNSSRMP
jgi:hypothetical protein